MAIVVVYHQDCLDGLAALWLLTKHHKQFLPHTGDLVTHACQYGTTARALVSSLYHDNNHSKDHLYLLDFSFFGKELAWLCDKFESVTVLDHHESALQEMTSWFQSNPTPYNLTLKLDMGKSGCMLTYDYLNSLRPLRQIPWNWIIEAVNDRDLWLFNDPDTKNLMAYITSHPMTVEAWDQIYQRDLPKREAAMIGGAIRQQLERQLEWHYNYGLRKISFGKYDIVAVNAPRYNASDLADYILTRQTDLPFVMVWYQDKDDYHYSLRSKDRVDVSVIAHSLGGGGHKNAASFRLTEPLTI